MQAVCDYLSEYCLDQYIDIFELNRQAKELDQLFYALSAALPEAKRELLQKYELALGRRFHMETEAMFQAAFAAAKELA